MSVKGLVENRNKITFEEVRNKVREFIVQADGLQVEVGVHIKDLETKGIAIITDYNKTEKKFQVDFIEYEMSKTYDVDSYLYEWPTENEISTSYYKKAIKENDTLAKRVYDLGYIYDIETQSVIRVIDIATSCGVICSRLSKGIEDSRLEEPIKEDTNMKGYFMNIDAFEVSEDNWRIATPAEVEFFKRKTEEAYQTNYSRLQEIIPFDI